MKNRATGVILRLFVFLIFIFYMTANAGEWHGYRGLSEQGKNDSGKMPLNWSDKQNVQWKTSIPGFGHSSPIVSGNNIYLTTAYTTKQGQLVTSVVMYARYILILFVVIAGLIVLIKSCTTQSLKFQQTVRLSIFLSLIALLTTGVLFDANLFDYERCVIRTWLGSSLIVNLCLIISTSVFPENSKRRFTLGIITIFFAVIVLIGFPAKDHAFRSGTNQFIAVAAIVLPLVFATLILKGYFFIPNSFSDDQPASAKRPTKASLAKNLLTIISISLVMLISGAIIITQVVRHSEYFSYHLSNVTFKPILGISSIYVLIAVSIITFAVFFLTDINRFKIFKAVFLQLLPYTLMSIALIAFAGNYLNGQNVLVRAIVSLDRNSGNILWISEGLAGGQSQMHRYNSPATPTPVTDGEHICAYFGTPGLMCVNAKGILLWTNEQVPFESAYGVGVSPVLSNGILIISSGMPAEPYVCAIDVKTGKEIWRKKQPVNMDKISGNSRTPVIHKVNGSQVVLVWGWDAFRGFDLKSGNELWKYPTQNVTSDMVASITAHGDTVYLPYPGWVDALSLSKLMRGEDPVIWSSVDGGANCSSPVLANDMLFAISDDGIATCLDAKTGKLLWTETLDGQYYSSLVSVGEKVLFTNHMGFTTVVAAEGQYRKIAENDLKERVAATIVPIDNRLLIRSENYLYCIQE